MAYFDHHPSNGGSCAAPRSRLRGVTNKTPREEEIQKTEEAKVAEKERLEREEEERLR